MSVDYQVLKQKLGLNLMGYAWFNSKVCIVVCESEFSLKAYIKSTSGLGEEIDLIDCVNWGNSFPLKSAIHAIQTAGTWIAIPENKENLDNFNRLIYETYEKTAEKRSIGQLDHSTKHTKQTFTIDEILDVFKFYTEEAPTSYIKRNIIKDLQQLKTNNLKTKI